MVMDCGGFARCPEWFALLVAGLNSIIPGNRPLVELLELI